MPRLAKTPSDPTWPLDNRLPTAGDAIVRTYKGRQVRVVVLGNGFEYDGRVQVAVRRARPSRLALQRVPFLRTGGQAMIAANRRRGKWTGGTPILGYDVDRTGPSPKLAVNAAEAARVREIFALYLNHGSLLPVVDELFKSGWLNKAWRTRQASRWAVGRSTSAACMPCSPTRSMSGRSGTKPTSIWPDPAPDPGIPPAVRSGRRRPGHGPVGRRWPEASDRGR